MNEYEKRITIRKAVRRVLGIDKPPFDKLKFDRKPWVKRGDRVKILCRKQYQEFKNRKTFNAFVIRTDGEYIYARVMWTRAVLCLYRNEVEKIV